MGVISGAGARKLLPWVLLMKSTDEQVRSIGSTLARQSGEEAIGRFLMLGSLRYDWNSLLEMLGGREMGLIRAIMDGSSIVQEIREDGVAEGRVQEGRRFLRLLLRKSFPSLESMPEIDQVSSIEARESLGETILRASSPDSVRHAILLAGKPN